MQTPVSSAVTDGGPAAAAATPQTGGESVDTADRPRRTSPPSPLRAAGSSYPPPPPGAWAPPSGDDPGPATPVTPTAVPFSYPPSGDDRLLRRVGTRAGAGAGKWRSWLPVAIVAALIGGGIGAGVTALANNNDSNGSNVTIHESTRRARAPPCSAATSPSPSS